MEMIDKNINEELNRELEHSAYEMAYTRPDAIDRCYSLGQKFAEHFIKVCKEGKNSEDYTHHCIEMQNLWDSVKGIRLKGNNKLISVSNLIDWFFTLGKDPEDFIPEEYISLYSKLYLTLLNNRETMTISTLLNEIL